MWDLHTAERKVLIFQTQQRNSLYNTSQQHLQIVLSDRDDEVERAQLSKIIDGCCFVNVEQVVLLRAPLGLLGLTALSMKWNGLLKE